KLLLFAACEKCIIDQRNAASLIGLFLELKVQVAEEQRPEPKTVIPMKWDVVTLWLRTDDDSTKTYEQRIVLVNPGGEDTGVATSSTFSLPVATHRIVATIFGFPIGVSGRHTLRVWVYETGKEAGSPVAEYPITVTYEVLKK